MSHVITLQPHSQTLLWLLHLTHPDGTSRVRTALVKLAGLSVRSQSGDVATVVTLYQCYQRIRHVEGYLDKEIQRWSALVKRQQTASIKTQPVSRQVFTLPLTNPVQAALIRVLQQLDTLACLTELARTLLLIKKRFVFAKKTQRHKRSVSKLVTAILQAQPVSEPLTPAHCEVLALALQAEVMPVWSTPIYRRLKQASQPSEGQ